MSFHKTPAHKTPAPQTLARTPRHDGWTRERQECFLERLSRTGNVRVACAAVGLSHTAAYRQRRRDARFARRWSIALGLARDAGIQTLSERAIEGVEEPVYYRGALVGRRRRYDTRLLLAHLARLDKLVDQATFECDLATYEDPFACQAGERAPEALGDEVSGREGEFFPRTMAPSETSPLAPPLRRE